MSSLCFTKKNKKLNKTYQNFFNITTYVYTSIKILVRVLSLSQPVDAWSLLLVSDVHIFLSMLLKELQSCEIVSDIFFYLGKEFCGLTIESRIDPVLYLLKAASRIYNLYTTTLQYQYAYSANIIKTREKNNLYVSIKNERNFCGYCGV